MESRDDEQGREKHGESTNKAPSVDLPASNFVCVSHFFTHNSTCSQTHTVRLMEDRMLFQARRFLAHTRTRQQFRTSRKCGADSVNQFTKWPENTKKGGEHGTRTRGIVMVTGTCLQCPLLM